MSNLSKLVIFTVALSVASTSFSVVGNAGIRSHRARRHGHVLFELKKNLTSSQIAVVNRVLTEQGLIRHNGAGEAAGLMAVASVDANARNTSVSEEELSKQLLATGAVAYAEPDYVVYPTKTFNDPYIPSEWHLNSINNFKAWDVTTGRSSVIVTVCDSGVDATHPDLKANVIQPGYNVVDGTTNTKPVNLHGTAVAGLIGASAGDSRGIAGIAPGVKILPVRVSNGSDGSAFLSDLAKCVRYGADHGARVINVSYTGADSPTMDAAGKYAVSKNALLVMAAGNAGEDISDTPNYASFIRVGATDSRDRLASFSNYGTAVSLVAPGVNVLTTVPNGYTYISGTSFASPITAAVAALIVSVDPSLSPANIKDILFRTADYIGNSYYFGNGRLNAGDAVDFATRYKH